MRGPAWHAQPGAQGVAAGDAVDFSLTPMRPKPPEMTRRTRTPVAGSRVSGASFMLCTTSKRRVASPGRSGTVS